MPRQYGGQIPVFRGYPVQAGRGFGSLLSGLLKTVVPVAKSVILPAAKSAGKGLLKHGARHASKALKSVARGQSIKKAVSKEVASAIADATQKGIEQAQRLAGQQQQVPASHRSRKRPRGPPGKRVGIKKAKRTKQINDALRSF